MHTVNPNPVLLVGEAKTQHNDSAFLSVTIFECGHIYTSGDGGTVEISYQSSATPSPMWLTYPGGDGPGQGKKIVLIAAEQEYRSEQSMPMLAKILSQHHGLRCPLPHKIFGKQARRGEDVLGGTFLNHHGRWHADSTRGFFDPNHAQHPILTAVVDIWGDSDVYRTYKVGASLLVDCTQLLWGQPLVGEEVRSGI